jgi:hypothetical protein
VSRVGLIVYWLDDMGVVPYCIVRYCVALVSVLCCVLYCIALYGLRETKLYVSLSLEPCRSLIRIRMKFI